MTENSVRPSRRDFLKGSASLAAGSLAVGSLTSTVFAAQTAKPSQSRKIIVAGGGIGGLCCGYELMKRGHDVTVLEASGRTGGHVWTMRDELADGFYADVGAEHFTEPGYVRYRQYVKEFNLPYLEYPRRMNMYRRIGEKIYSEEMLADPKVLATFGYNAREIDFLKTNHSAGLIPMYLRRYLDQLKDEYQPFAPGLKDLDGVSLRSIVEKEGASATVIGNASKSESALFHIWQFGIQQLREVPYFNRKTFRLKGGNQQLPNAFAARLGERVRLGCPITQIDRQDTGVRVKYSEYGEEKSIEGDYLVNAIPLTLLRSISVTPDWPAEKKFVMQNMFYSSYCRVIMQSRTPFWKEQNLSPNVELGLPELRGIWQTNHEVAGPRCLMLGSAPRTTSDKALAAFREFWPGGSDSLEQVIVHDWAKDRWRPECERLPFPMGQLDKFWPNIIEPVGRIHFVGAYADNLNWGMEAATRSANRVAEQIHQL